MNTGIWSCISKIALFALASMVCSACATTNAREVNITQVEDTLDKLFAVLEDVAGPYAYIGRGVAKLAIKMIQLEDRVQKTEDRLQKTEDLFLKSETKLQETEELLQKVARPYLSLPNDTIGEEYYMRSFNFLDQMASSMCTAVAPVSTDSFPARRDCGKSGIPSSQTCNAICNSMSGSQCFNALHIYRKDNTLRELNPNYGPYPSDNKINLKTYKYGTRGCTWTPNHCGPNYCCCRS